MGRNAPFFRGYDVNLYQPIPFAEWLPDQPDHANPGATEAKNVIPAEQSYKQLNGLNIHSSALAARAQGAVAAIDSSGNIYDFVGTSTKLYKLETDATFTDVAQVGGYTTAADGYWNFQQWGDDILATNFDDPIQTYTLGVSTKFADLHATAPQARYITQVRDFVVVGNTYDATDGNVPNRVRWSAIGDPTASWAVSASTQADYEDLNSAKGWVQGVVGGEYGVVFQESAISRMTYVGSPAVFQFDEVESERGCYIPRSIVQVGHLIFYISEDGFYVFNRESSTPIGAGKVDKTFFNDFDENYKDRVTAAADPINKLIIWAYPSTSATSGNPDKLIIYNWKDNRWSHAEVTTEMIFTSESLGYTLEDLDVITTDLDALPFSLDSRAWTGGSRLLSAFNTDHKMCFFNGSALSGVIETAEFQLYKGNRANLTRLLPIVDGTTTVQVGTRNLHTDSVSWTAAVSPNSTTGECDVRSNARYHRVRVNTSGSFNHAQGVEIVSASKAGRR